VPTPPRRKRKRKVYFQATYLPYSSWYY
jgi:hypothetical protein